MYPRVKNVQPTAQHRLVLGFDNGERRIFDVTPLLGVGRFRALKSSREFEKVRIAFDTVEWENGLDLDPEYLYERREPLPCEDAVTTEPAGRGPARPWRQVASVCGASDNGPMLVCFLRLPEG